MESVEKRVEHAGWAFIVERRVCRTWNVELSEECAVLAMALGNGNVECGRRRGGKNVDLRVWCVECIGVQRVLSVLGVGFAV